MTQPWTFAGDPPSDRRSSGAAVTLIDGTTFTISEDTGDIEGGTHGLFVRDTRMLSRWQLGINGNPVSALTVQRSSPHSAAFLARTRPQAGQADSPVFVVRRRYVGSGQREDISLHNSSPHAFSCLLTLLIDSDFADLFEVKDGRALASGVNPAPRPQVNGHGTVRLARQRGSRTFATVVSADQGAEATDFGLQWRAVVPARGTWSTTIEAVAELDGATLALRHPRGDDMAVAAPMRDLEAWRTRGVQVSTPNRDLLESLRRSHEDLGTLRVFQPDDPERAVVAAGAPWFMALFGRDSLLTSLMMLPVDTNLAIGTLKTLAEHQGRKLDAQSEEEPGKVLHEMRFGPAVNLSLGGRREYYGSVDATPLFVMALGELYKWRGLDDDVLGLVPAADRALEWITQYGDSDNDGFVEYRRKTDHGLVNQGWKDSWDGINFADGQLAEPPIALAEVQGYVYAAFLARARLANALGESAVERDCTERAQALRRRFNEAFWLPEHGWFAVGLDATKRPIDALTSNIGHCLWTGIVDADKAPQVAAHLLSPAMFSGWGIRTLANTMAAYNPLSYHNGSVWPHDTAICASGLMRNGLVAEAQKVADAILRASRFFGHRLPELFGGFDRDQFAAPVPYPTACSPQAWAAAAPLELLRTMLRFEPDIPAAQIVCAPVVPDRYLPLRVENLIVGEKTLSVSVTDTGTSFTGTATQSYDISSDHHDEETATCG